MRRLVLSISLSILAFCIGVTTFYMLAPQLSETAEVQTEEIAPVILPTAPEDDYRSSKEQELASIMRRLTPLVQRWLKGEKIKDGTLVWLESFGESISPGEGQAQPYFLDVNGDNKKDMAVRTGCSTVGNCNFLLFERTKDGYKTILFTDGVQLFHLNKTKTNGYFDLEATAHGSAISGQGVIYHFGDDQYQPVSHYSYQYPVHGYSAIPEITAMDCCEIYGYTRLTPDQISDDSAMDEVNEEKTEKRVFQPTINKWLKGEKVRKELTEASDETVREMGWKSKSELSEDQARWFWDYRYTPKTMDVNGDGIPELTLMNQCAPVGNCQLWIFRKTGRSYERILKSEPGAIQVFKCLESKTNGFCNLETKAHGSASSGGITIYKFDGNKYRKSECSSYDYEYLGKDGKIHQYDEVKITPRKCEE